MAKLASAQLQALADDIEQALQAAGGAAADGEAAQLAVAQARGRALTTWKAQVRDLLATSVVVERS